MHVHACRQNRQPPSTRTPQVPPPPVSCCNLIGMTDPRERVLREVESLTDEVVAFTADLVRIPTVNPPGELYAEGARFLGERLAQCGFEIEYHAARGRPEHTPAHPRANVVGTRRGNGPGPVG